jgi:hypothetical protein
VYIPVSFSSDAPSWKPKTLNEAEIHHLNCTISRERKKVILVAIDYSVKILEEMFSGSKTDWWKI